ncbi:MAG: hypothetical protein Q9170_002649 [Blastenia crenularia]
MYSVVYVAVTLVVTALLGYLNPGGLLGTIGSGAAAGTWANPFTAKGITAFADFYVALQADYIFPVIIPGATSTGKPYIIRKGTTVLNATIANCTTAGQAHFQLPNYTLSPAFQYPSLIDQGQEAFLGITAPSSTWTVVLISAFLLVTLAIATLPDVFQNVSLHKEIARFERVSDELKSKLCTIFEESTADLAQLLGETLTLLEQQGLMPDAHAQDLISHVKLATSKDRELITSLTIERDNAYAARDTAYTQRDIDLSQVEEQKASATTACNEHRQRLLDLEEQLDNSDNKHKRQLQSAMKRGKDHEVQVKSLQREVDESQKAHVNSEAHFKQRLGSETERADQLAVQVKAIEQKLSKSSEEHEKTKYEYKKRLDSEQGRTKDLELQRDGLQKDLEESKSQLAAYCALQSDAQALAALPIPNSDDSDLVEPLTSDLKQALTMESHQPESDFEPISTPTSPDIPSVPSVTQSANGEPVARKSRISAGQHRRRAIYRANNLRLKNEEAAFIAAYGVSINGLHAPAVAEAQGNVITGNITPSNPDKVAGQLDASTEQFPPSSPPPKQESKAAAGSTHPGWAAAQQYTQPAQVMENQASTSAPPPSQSPVQSPAAATPSPAPNPSLSSKPAAAQAPKPTTPPSQAPVPAPTSASSTNGTPTADPAPASASSHEPINQQQTSVPSKKPSSTPNAADAEPKVVARSSIPSSDQSQRPANGKVFSSPTVPAEEWPILPRPVTSTPTLSLPTQPVVHPLVQPQLKPGRGRGGNPPSPAENWPVLPRPASSTPAPPLPTQPFVQPFVQLFVQPQLKPGRGRGEYQQSHGGFQGRERGEQPGFTSRRARTMQERDEQEAAKKAAHRTGNSSTARILREADAREAAEKAAREKN